MCPGMPYDWSADGNFFVIADSQSIRVLSTFNYSVIQTIPVNGSIQTIALSYDGSKIGVELFRQQNKSLMLIDVLSMNSTLFYDFSKYSHFEIQFLSWSDSRNQLQMIENDFTRNSSLRHLYQIIWNVSDNGNVTIYAIKDLGGLYYSIADAIFSKYITLERPQPQQSQLKLYDLEGVKNVFSLRIMLGRFRCHLMETLLRIQRMVLSKSLMRLLEKQSEPYTHHNMNSSVLSLVLK